MRFLTAVCLLLGSILIGACGGKSNPAGPDPVEPEDFTLTFLAARTGRPVAEASVSVGGTVYRTDGAGQVTVKALAGQAVTVQADGFLQPRVLVVRHNLTDYLWEEDSLTPADYILALLYQDRLDGRLFRPAVSYAVVGADQASILNNSTAHQALLRAISALNSADQNVEWSVVSGNPPANPSAMSIRLYVDANDPGFVQQPNAGALAYMSSNGFVSTGGRVVFRGIDIFPGDHLIKAMAHELGHMRGLGHGIPRGIMGSASPLTAFVPEEVILMRNAFLRPPGNRYPDDSTGVQSSGFGKSSERLVCGEYE